MTDTLQLIKERISANKFDVTRQLSEGEIKELVTLAAEAPSSYNIQHWRFIAVTDQPAIPGQNGRKPMKLLDALQNKRRNSKI